MILALDAGNTQITGTVFSAEGERTGVSFRRSSSRSLSPDELGVFLRGVLREKGIDPSSVRAVAACSVVRELRAVIVGAGREYFGLEVSWLEPSKGVAGIAIGYREARELGADRLAAAVGAAATFPGRDVLIVDFGTAITVDALDAQGTLLGGAILPGPRLSMSALEGQTSRLPAVDLERPASALGRSTLECIRSGLYFSTLGAVREVVGRLADECFGGRALVLGTGGLAALFSEEELFDELLPDLVLQGLCQAHVRKETSCSE